MIEIEFIPIGEQTNTGDAILCHFTDPLTGSSRVVLIDGGFKETSGSIVAHIRQHYHTNRIDLMVCTHPDDDHINGLFGVFEELEVGQLLIHQPSFYGFTSDDVKADKVDELIHLARMCGTEVITDAFAGSTFLSGALLMVGPTEAYYKELLSGQSDTASLASRVGSVFQAAAHAAKRLLLSRTTDPGEGELTDDGGTTPRNNSSIILDLQVDGYRALFTGDAGAPALAKAADHLEASGRATSFPDLFDIPHHGSRHNLTSEVLNRLAGPIVGDTRARSAFVSVGKEADDFPRAAVANAFTRRGYSVCATRGKTIRWSRKASPRPGWVPITPLAWLEVSE